MLKWKTYFMKISEPNDNIKFCSLRNMLILVFLVGGMLPKGILCGNHNHTFNITITNSTPAGSSTSTVPNLNVDWMTLSSHLGMPKQYVLDHPVTIFYTIPYWEKVSTAYVILKGNAVETNTVGILDYGCYPPFPNRPPFKVGITFGWWGPGFSIGFGFEYFA